MPTIGEGIRRWIALDGRSVTELAPLIGRHRKTIESWMKGRTQKISSADLRQLAAVLNLTEDELRAGPPPPAAAWRAIAEVREQLTKMERLLTGLVLRVQDLEARPKPTSEE